MQNDCGLFFWDDMVSEAEVNSSRCCECDMSKGYLREFSKEIVEERSNKVEKLKRKVTLEKTKNFWMMIAIVLSWMFFAVVYDFK